MSLPLRANFQTAPPKLQTVCRVLTCNIQSYDSPAGQVAARQPAQCQCKKKNQTLNVKELRLGPAERPANGEKLDFFRCFFPVAPPALSQFLLVSAKYKTVELSGAAAASRGRQNPSHTLKASGCLSNLDFEKKEEKKTESKPNASAKPRDQPRRFATTHNSKQTAEVE